MIDKLLNLDMETKSTYPIKAVSLKTGLSIHVIRAWEKRYQTVTPKRTETNRRLYAEQDIEKLKLLKLAIGEGHNIGNIASLQITELRKLITTDFGISQERKEAVPDTTDEANQYIVECLAAVKNFNALSLEKALLNASLQLSQAVFIDSVIIPLVIQIGDMWHDGNIRIMHEHMATDIIKTFLSNMRNNYRAESDAPVMVVTTPLGQNHEMGALILSLAAATEGWNVTYLGPNLPAEEIASAAKNKDAISILLSIVYPADDHYLKQDLLKLQALLPNDISIIVGGRMAKNYLQELETINATIMDDISDFRKISATLKTGKIILR